MDRRVLLLNASGEPLCFVRWTRALNLVLRGKVHVYEYYADTVHSASAAYRVPAVVALMQYVTIPAQARVVRLSKRNLMTRDEGACQYCGHEVRSERATVDHVLPRARGGVHRWDNVVLSCKPCNGRKDSRTPEEAGMALRKKPWTPSRVLLLRQVAEQGGYEAWRSYLGMAPGIA